MDTRRSVAASGNSVPFAVFQKTQERITRELRELGEITKPRNRYYRQNKSVISIKCKAYYSANRERILARIREYRQTHWAEVVKKQKDYYQRNLEKRREYQRKYYRKRKNKMRAYDKFFAKPNGSKAKKKQSKEEEVIERKWINFFCPVCKKNWEIQVRKGEKLQEMCPICYDQKFYSEKE